MEKRPARPGETLILASLPFYTEGPVMDDTGNIYVTTLTGGAIIKIDACGNSREWALSDCPNGQVIVPGGDHLVCDSRTAAVKRFSSSGTFLRNDVSGTCAGVEVFTPNDLLIDDEANMYFTDSVRYAGKVFCVHSDGCHEILAADLDYPNGLALSADRQWLFVSESYRNRIIRISLTTARGKIGVVAELPAHPSGRATDNLPDGLAVATDGTIWVAHYGMQAVHRYKESGVCIRSYDTLLPLTSNLFFADDHTLVVTGGDGEPGPGKVIKLFV